MKILPIAIVAFIVCIGAGAQNATTNSYTQTNLVSDIPGLALSTESQLVNPWGLSKPASATVKEAHWWAADQRTGVSTLYDADGSVVPLTITIPAANGSGPGSPTGTLAIGNNFVFVTLDGTISEWINTTPPPQTPFVHSNPRAKTCASCHATSATIKVNHSSAGAVYTGCALAKRNGVPTVYVAKAAGSVEAYDTNFNPVSLAPGAFTDPNLPAGYAPYGIQSAGQKIYVTFSPPAPASGGYVDAFDPSGSLLLTLQQGAWLNEPWGIAQAPANFGPFSNTLLVGNTGSGQIAAFNPRTGKFIGVLKDSNNVPLANPGLWAIAFGAGNVDSGPANTLYFNAGIQNFTHGLFGAITAN